MSDSYPYYKKKRETELLKVPEDLTLIRRKRQNAPEGYCPDSGLVDAVNVALLLGQPLLLMGEAGTGKTELANNLSWQLGFGKESPFKFETKSTTTARDLFYSYDTVGRFHAAQTKLGSQKNRDYITYNALGLAILFANPKSDVIEYLPTKNSKEAAFFDSISKDNWQRRSVVLIDEIDKAPRDFPNDILNEIERMFFRVAELDNKIFEVEDEKFRPVIILTSNSEKNLPDAFLRRCVYYNIVFPKTDALKNIVDERIGGAQKRREEKEFRWYDTLIDLFERLRDSRQMVKNPATAELLGWLTAVGRLLEHYEIPENDRERETYLKSTPGREKIVNPTLCVLLKNADDPENAKPIIVEWARNSA